jgi:hypothetical protein
MTLITGMIATDGWVLAADRLGVQATGDPQSRPINATFRSETTKLIWTPEANIIFGYSGDYVTRLAGEAVVSEMRQVAGNPEGRATVLTRATQSAWKLHLSNASGMIYPQLRLLIVIFTRPPIEMWIVKVENQVEVDRIEDKALIGDLHNGAKLFPLLYYCKRPSRVLKKGLILKIRL